MILLVETSSSFGVSKSVFVDNCTIFIIFVLLLSKFPHKLTWLLLSTIIFCLFTVSIDWSHGVSVTDPNGTRLFWAAIQGQGFSSRYASVHYSLSALRALRTS